ncbi:MAG: hypothetical protein R3F62_03345 [Planctomycetota bacterium]
MGLFDALRGLVGGARVQLDEPDAEGEAAAAVAALIPQLKQALSLELREGCTEAYLEAVLKRPELDACTGALTGALGEPKKPFGERPAFDRALAKLIDSQGGIEAGQCLFLRRFSDGRVAFAALWPWSNGAQITLKLGVYASA